MKSNSLKEPGKKLHDRGLSTDGTPLMSVITPYYNAGKYFEQTFNCVMNQTFPWFEWIIVDDGSTDEESIRILEQCAARDGRIRTYRKENGRASTARNLAIENSITDIIVPLDADNLLTPVFLETQYWALKCNPDHGWSYCSSIGFQDQEPKTRALADRLIREAAKTADVSVRAKEYPVYGPADQYAAPEPSDWGRKVFASHEKTHVLMLLPWMEMGGADRFNLELCAGLDKTRFEIGIITTQAAENTWKQRFEEHVADIFCLPDFLGRENWPEFVSYFIKSREVDVLFLSNSYYGYYLLPWLRKEFPDLAILDYVHMEEWYWRRGGYARTCGAMGSILEKTYVCNEKTRQVLIHDFGRDAGSVETLYIGVDETHYDPSRIKPGMAKKKLGIAPERPMILFPCRLHPQKRPFLMLEIAKKLQKELPGAAIAVVGDGPQLAALEQAAKREKLQGAVFFAGRQDDMRPWYRDAALTLLCSLKEGVALTAYESLAMGVPVVTSDAGGQGELVDETVGRVLPLFQSEETGLDDRNFDQKEISQYVEAIRDLLADEGQYKRMSKACRRRIEAAFSLRDMIHRMEEILEALPKEGIQERREKAALLRQCGALPSELITLYTEIDSYEASYKNGFSDEKGELLRMANSKWGRRAIRLAFRLGLNRLFR